MSTSRWQRIEEVFHAALERRRQDRESFLAEACKGDPELLHEVQSLLTETDKRADFMERPAMDVEAESMSREPSEKLAGRFIAHYLMGPLLGAGGMAEVYRARDTRLNRDVAIKVLPGSSSLDTEAFGRFQREARLLASVTHPNVAAVYGFEELSDQCALVMELIEGETLADRIQRERLSVEQVLTLARQVAAAVEAAHAKAIVHRDLKPANIRIATDGTVKVLDFGLAKIFQPVPEADLTHSVFATRGLPILGTVAYMSPEQARGKPVDTRTDIWAMGCIIYEMLTGKRAFEGSTWTDTIARIASENPDWSRLPHATPSDVRSLLVDCLQKDPERRLRQAAEVRRRLENAAHGTPRAIPEGEIALTHGAARLLFIGIQVGYLAMYVAALIYLDTLDPRVSPVLVGTFAMSGIAIRLYLLSSVGLSHPEAGHKFRRLFPVLLLLDAAWAASPLLAVKAIGFGVALAGAAGLAYLPFSQRTLMHRIYG